ncbi:hypothetical protein [Mycobacterium leprae]|nr:hypothetical protein [Mycobacterium leprae]
MSLRQFASTTDTIKIKLTALSWGRHFNKVIGDPSGNCDVFH